MHYSCLLMDLINKVNNCAFDKSHLMILGRLSVPILGLVKSSLVGYWMQRE